MKYRAVAMGLIIKEREVASYSNSMEVIMRWAHDISKEYRVNVKIYETYERVMLVVKKPYERKSAPPPLESTIVYSLGKLSAVEHACVCGIHTFCSKHPEKGRKDS